jgi:hypothetical protein
MTRILKDSLVHSLVLGLGLFVLFDRVASDEATYDSKVINLDRDALWSLLQRMKISRLREYCHARLQISAA